jgi:hypothetical protein
MDITVYDTELRKVTSRPFESLTTSIKKVVLSKILAARGQTALAMEVAGSRFFRFNVRVTSVLDTRA